MRNVSNTLYIPLYGKALVSRKGVILHDPMAERIWENEGFALKGKARSIWLTYYMGMRAAVFDRWLAEAMLRRPDAVVLHIGCGMDSRVSRVGTCGHSWYDVDYPDVIAERRKYYGEDARYHMIGSDARDREWLNRIDGGREALVVMEGLSMYLKKDEMLSLLTALTERFPSVEILMDCYTVFAARVSRYKNPINEVGVTELYGVDDPAELEAAARLRFVKEHDLTPDGMIEELKGFEKRFFRAVFTGRFANRIYRLFEYAAP